MLAAGIYALTQGELSYTNTSHALTIIGQGSSTVIDQLSLDRVLRIRLRAQQR